MFVDCSALLVANPPQRAYGIGAFVLAPDQATAFFVCGFGDPNRVLAWDGAALVDRYDPVLYQADRSSIGVAAGDLDGDGAEEIYVLNTDTFGGRKRLGDHCFAWRGNGWVDLWALPENAARTNPYAGRSVLALDRLGDGHYGFLAASYGAAMQLYESSGGDALQEVAEPSHLAAITGGRSLIALPLVSPPGRLDLFAATEDGPNCLFVPRGDGDYSEQAGPVGLADRGSHGRGVAALDDGAFGFALVIGNWRDEHRLFRQSAPGFFTDIAPPELRRPSAVRTVIVADFDNDGFEEIFFNQIDEPNRLFGFRDGAWTRIPIGDAAEPYGLGTGAAVADIDGDGFLELLIAHGEMGAQPLGFYRVDDGGADNDWLRVAPRTRFGAPARGALVTVVTSDGLRQKRVIDGGSGYLCQMEPVAHFGLGKGRTVLSVEVVWPGGTRIILDRPNLRQTLTVAYPH
jgi:hypothetical protein